MRAVSTKTRLVTLTAWVCLCSAGPVLPQGVAPAASPVATPTFVSEKAKAEALGKIRLVADQIQALTSSVARVEGLATIGRIVCNFDKDLTHATFERAYAIVQTAEAKEAPALRRALLPQVARCDANLAFLWRGARQEGEAGKSDDAITDLSTARALLDAEPSVAARFLGPALEQLPDAPMQGAMITLMELRKKNMETSDALFLSLLAGLRRELRPEANRVLLVGNYLFTAPPNPAIPEQYRSTGVTFTSIGAGRPGWVSTYNLMADRPGMNPAMVRPYLEAALDIFSRPVKDAKQQAADYVALVQLMDKVPRFAPELAAPFTLLRERLAANVSEMLRQPASYDVLTRMNFGPSLEDRIAAEPDPVKRDQWRLQRLASAWTRSDLSSARKHVAEIEDKDTRAAAQGVLLFFDASKAIADGKLMEAEDAVRKMAPGAKRALLALGLSVAFLGRGEKNAAEAWWGLAHKDARIADYSARAALLLAVADVGATLNPEAALSALDSSVTEFNASEKPASPERDEPEISPWNRMAQKPGPQQSRSIVLSYAGGFLEQIYHGDYSSQLRLTVPGVNVWDFTPGLMNRFGADADRVHSILLKLNDEVRRSSALSALTSAYVTQASKRREPAGATKPEN